MQLRHLVLLALVSCQRTPTTDPAPPPVVDEPVVAPVDAKPLPSALAKILPADAGPPRLGSVKNLDRLPDLTARHGALLSEHGFFVAAQSRPKPGQTAAEARTSQRAKHLFQVYERNDYIRFPSYVTVDLAIDLTHQYFDVILKRVEREYLVPRMRTSLAAFVAKADALGKTVKTAEGKAAARSAAIYWGTILRLLEQPAKGDAADEIVARMPYEEDEETPKPAPTKVVLTPLPKDVEREVATIVAKVHAAAAKEKFPDWGLELDLTQTKPRGHYSDNGVMQRYFRAMSVLGMSTFAVTGEHARPELLFALTASYAADASARKAFEEVRTITAFAVGEPATLGFDAAHSGMQPQGATFAGALAAKSAILRKLAKLPPHPVEAQGPVVQPMGQRVFLDTLAMSKMLPILRDLPPDRTDLVARAMGAAGAAAVLGSDEARAIVVEGAGEQGDAIGKAIAEGRTTLAAAGSKGDAYHRTLNALAPLLSADPIYFDASAYRRRMLQSFAGGWAMLRHDTLLYAYQMGAECDAEDLPAPYGWVEPVPEVYAGLAQMVGAFAKALKDAGIQDPPRAEDDISSIHYRTIEEKTRAVVDFLGKLEAWSRQELEGKPFDEAQRTEVAMVGGFAEHVVLTLADAFELGDGNDDMAVIADVFTFQGRALEVGVGHPELVYAIVPTPKGWVVARGAVLAYREFFVPVADRMTDEAWRKRLEASSDFEAKSRPAWLADITAEPVGVIEVAKDLGEQHRCEYYGGSYEL